MHFLCLLLSCHAWPESALWPWISSQHAELYTVWTSRREPEFQRNWIHYVFVLFLLIKMPILPLNLRGLCLFYHSCFLACCFKFGLAPSLLPSGRQLCVSDALTAPPSQIHGDATARVRPACWFRLCGEGRVKGGKQWGINLSLTAGESSSVGTCGEHHHRPSVEKWMDSPGVLWFMIWGLTVDDAKGPRANEFHFLSHTCVRSFQV